MRRLSNDIKVPAEKKVRDAFLKTAVLRNFLSYHVQCPLLAFPAHLFTELFAAA